MKTWIIIIISVLLIFLLIGLASWGIFEYSKEMNKRAERLDCVWDFRDYCYREDSSGDLVRYEMKNLGDEWRLVR